MATTTFVAVRERENGFEGNAMDVGDCEGVWG